MKKDIIPPSAKFILYQTNAGAPVPFAEGELDEGASCKGCLQVRQVDRDFLEAIKRVESSSGRKSK